MELFDLFAAADEIGDKYLTAEEIEKRDREFAEAVAAVPDVPSRSQELLEEMDITITRLEEWI